MGSWQTNSALYTSSPASSLLPSCVRCATVDVIVAGDRWGVGPPPACEALGWSSGDAVGQGWVGELVGYGCGNSMEFV
jgi:hypothetical protein